MSLVTVLMLHPKVTRDHLGLIPFMLDGDDPAPAREQFDRNYPQGGGWQPFKGFKLLEDNSLEYPGDPSLKPIAEIVVLPKRAERIFVYDYSWVAIIQPDRSFEVCRMD